MVNFTRPATEVAHIIMSPSGAENELPAGFQCRFHDGESLAQFALRFSRSSALSSDVNDGPDTACAVAGDGQPDACAAAAG